MKKGTVLIFDFDGTIADSPIEMIQIFNRIAKDYGLKPIKKEDHEKLRNLSSLETLKFLGISLYKLPFISRRIRDEFKKDISDLKPIPGIIEMLKKLHERGELLGIMTSNSEENVKEFLKNHEMEFFEFVVGSSSMFGKHKVLGKIIRERKLNQDEVIYVGDEARDIDAARKAKVKIISVTWGVNSKEFLSRQNPDYLIDEPKALLLI